MKVCFVSRDKPSAGWLDQCSNLRVWVERFPSRLFSTMTLTSPESTSLPSFWVVVDLYRLVSFDLKTQSLFV